LHLLPSQGLNACAERLPEDDSTNCQEGNATAAASPRVRRRAACRSQPRGLIRKMSRNGWRNLGCELRISSGRQILPDAAKFFAEFGDLLIAIRLALLHRAIKSAAAAPARVWARFTQRPSALVQHGIGARRSLSCRERPLAVSIS